MGRQIGFLVVALVACLTFALPSASAAPRCQASDLTASAFNPFEMTSIGNLGGNATPIIGRFADIDSLRQVKAIRITNRSERACFVHGHPRLALLKDGNSLPARVRRVGASPIIEKVLLPWNGTAAIVVGHHNKPAGNGTRCRTSTNLLVALPGMGHLNLPAGIRACNDGLLYASPVMAVQNPIAFAMKIDQLFPGSLSIGQGNRAPQDELGFFNTGTGNVGFGNTGDNNLGSRLVP
jgi:Protein of unknown function (DUF4232)